MPELLDPILKPVERPMLYQGAMVRAILRDVEPKTQTRRLVSEQPPEEVSVYAGTVGTYSGLAVPVHYWKTAEDYEAAEAAGKEYVYWPGADDDGFAGDVYGAGGMECPYGHPVNCLRPATRIWVKETFYAFGRWETRFNAKKARDEWHFVDLTLEAGKTYSYPTTDSTPLPMRGKRDAGVTPGWWKRPAIFMPRAASRILLEVTEVRVERLQDISEADAKAEGCEPMHWIDLVDSNAGDLIDWPLKEQANPYRNGYALLWDSINGKTPGAAWADNPWVWAVSFRRVTP